MSLEKMFQEYYCIVMPFISEEVNLKIFED